MKKVVVSFADEAGSYRRAMKRLEHSLFANGFDGIFKGYTSFEEIGSPPHKGLGSVPYAFKAYAIKKAIQECGDALYLWCDSPIFATQSVQPIFDHIEKEGYIFFDNVGYSIGSYTSDACLEKWGMSREESYKHPMIMACLMGFNTDNSDAKKVLELYISAASDGVSYLGDWFNDRGQVSKDTPRCFGHRHDQSASSLIIHSLKMNITNAQQTFFAYKSHKEKMNIAESVCLWSGGI